MVRTHRGKPVCTTVQDRGIEARAKPSLYSWYKPNSEPPYTRVRRLFATPTIRDTVQQLCMSARVYKRDLCLILSAYVGQAHEEKGELEAPWREQETLQSELDETFSGLRKRR